MASTSGVVIANGASVSNVIDIMDGVITGITLGAWTGTEITLLGAQRDSDTFVPVHAADGTEVSFTVAADRHVYVDPNVTRGVRYVKIRSGDTAAAVNQAAARSFTVTVERSGGA